MCLRRMIEVLKSKDKEEIARLTTQLEDSRKTKYIHPQEQFWNNKYPTALITYGGRYMPRLKPDSPFDKIDIPVQLFITPNDQVIQNDIKAYGLGVKDPFKCNEDILQLYRHTRTKPLNPYRYEFDQPNTGVPEFWFFPHELRFAKKGDCDDWGNELASYLIAAGVPRFRVRNYGGYTWGNYGHLTVYVLADDLTTWYHLNSTTPINTITQTKLEEFPKHGDPNDEFGIRDGWFSFNDMYAWHTFKTDMAATSFMKRPGFLKNIKIEAMV